MAAVTACLVASSLAAAAPAASQSGGPPAITGFDAVAEAYIVYGFIGTSISWTVDPAAPQPSHYRIGFTTGGTTTTTGIAAPATGHVDFDLRAETAYEVTLFACVGEEPTESCDSASTTLTTPALPAPRVQFDTVTATATSPTSISTSWSYSPETNIGIVMQGVQITPEGGSPLTWHDVRSTPFVWDGATPGTTYQVDVYGCGGASPTSLICDGGSATVTTPSTQPAQHTISGQVTSAGGPLEGATVLAAADTDIWYPTALTSTAADGSFVLDDLPPGTYKVSVVSPSGSHLGWYWHGGDRSRAAATPITLDGDPVDLDLVFPERTMVTGSVASAGTPVAGARVSLYRATDGWVGSAVTSTGTDGTFAFRGLDPGTYKVLARPPVGAGAATWHGGSSRATATPHVVDGSTFALGVDVDVAPG